MRLPLSYRGDRLDLTNTLNLKEMCFSSYWSTKYPKYNDTVPLCLKIREAKDGNGPGDTWGTAVRNKDEELKTCWESMVLQEYRIVQEGVFITPQEAMEPVLNESLIEHESKPSPKALKSSLAFHNS